MSTEPSGGRSKHGPAPYVLRYIDFAEAFLWLVEVSSADWEAEASLYAESQR